MPGKPFAPLPLEPVDPNRHQWFQPGTSIRMGSVARLRWGRFFLDGNLLAGRLSRDQDLPNDRCIGREGRAAKRGLSAVRLLRQALKWSVRQG
jgi:hypothetical protein